MPVWGEGVRVCLCRGRGVSVWGRGGGCLWGEGVRVCLCRGRGVSVWGRGGGCLWGGGGGARVSV